MSKVDMAAALEAARDAVAAGGDAARRFFRAGVETSRKADGSLVTQADHAAEKAILSIIRERFPGHAVLTEESGALEGDQTVRWIIDPLDGTHRFARGLRTWGPMVALEQDGDIVAGAIALPALGETYWAARGMGAYLNGEPLEVSQITDWSRANLSLGSIARILETPASQGVLELVRRADYTLAGGDLAGGAAVLRGEAEVWIEAGVQPWDIAPFKVLVEEAGGRCTDFQGGFDLSRGEAVVSNGAMHDGVMKAIRG